MYVQYARVREIKSQKEVVLKGKTWFKRIVREKCPQVYRSHQRRCCHKHVRSFDSCCLIAGHLLFVRYLVKRAKQVLETSLTCPWTAIQGIIHEHRVSTHSYTENLIHNNSVFASQLCKHILSLSLVCQCLVIVDQILGNCATPRVFTCRFQTTEQGSLRPCLFLSSSPSSLQRSELTGDMGGWCQSSPQGTQGSSGVSRGWAAAPKGKRWWQREGRNSLLLFCFVCFFTCRR